MIQKDFDAIDAADIAALVENGENESKTLEYKGKLPGGTDLEKKEFLADVSSFANASGGDIVYGIKAAVDDNGKNTGAPESVQPLVGVNADEAKLRLEQTIRSGIDPRVRFQMKEVPVGAKDAQRFVIVLRIPRSLASPHMVTYKGSSRFYSRNSAGKWQLDVHEIRSAFLATELQAERIKRFRQDRLGKIVADETPVVLSSRRRMVLHLIPITSFLNNDRVDLSNDHKLGDHFRPIGRQSTGHRYNLDGFVTVDAPRAEPHVHIGYCQVFSHGAVEAVAAELFDRHPVRDGEKEVFSIPSGAYERDLIKATKSYLEGMSLLGLTAPIAISLTLLGCRDAMMYIDEFVTRRLESMRILHGIDRDSVVVQDIVIDDLKADVTTAMKPIFDAVWNACGFPRSLNYDEQGNCVNR